MKNVSTEQLIKKVASNLNTMVLSASSEKPVMLLLHGWGQNLLSLHMLGSLLNKDRTVHLIDLPGFGKSPLPDEAKTKDGAWTTKHYAQVIIEYLRINNLSKVDVLGHSFGGRVCLQLAAHFPASINRMILMDAAGLKPLRSFGYKARLFRIRSLGAIIKMTRRITGEKINKKWHGWFSQKYGSSDYKSANDMRNVLVKTVNEDQENNAKKIKHPTYLIWGAEDDATPLDQAERLHKYIQNSDLLVLDNKGHMPYESLGAHLIVYHLRKFLAK